MEYSSSLPLKYMSCLITCRSLILSLVCLILAKFSWHNTFSSIIGSHSHITTVYSDLGICLCNASFLMSTVALRSHIFFWCGVGFSGIIGSSVRISSFSSRHIYTYDRFLYKVHTYWPNLLTCLRYISRPSLEILKFTPLSSSSTHLLFLSV